MITMTIASQIVSTSYTAPPYPVHRFSVAKYREMVETGILTEDDGVELLEGWITEKMPHNPPHDVTVGLIDEGIRSALSDEWKIRIQSAITTDESEPEPDIAVVRGPLRTYAKRHPAALDIAMVAEIAETSLQRDRNKRRIYAGANIPVYWIINLADSQIEVYTDPSGPALSPQYATTAIFKRGDSLPVEIAGQIVAILRVEDLLP
jgi:Uma2 family endonuclease